MNRNISWLQKKKSGVKKCLEIMSIKGGGRRLMEKSILNFHFDYLPISLRRDHYRDNDVYVGAPM